MPHRPIEAAIDAGGGEQQSGAGVPPDVFRDALSHWASGVTVAAVRDEGRVYATTITSFASVSVEPPQVALSLNAGAQVLPFLQPEARFGVSMLAGDQRRLATVFADSFPVGPSPFEPEGIPLVSEALVTLECAVVSVLPAAPARLVLARVERARIAPERSALVYHRRTYRALE